MTSRCHLHLADQAIRRHLADCLKESDGVMHSQDIEHLHRMRVASRRLRNVLRTFRHLLEPSDYASVYRPTKRLAVILGQARDLDTQLQFLDTLLNNCPPNSRSAIRSLREHILLLRKKIQPDVQRAVQSFTQKKLLSQIDRCLAGLAREETKNLHRLKKTFSKTIKSQLKDLLSYERYAARPEKIKKLHALRIAAKHLRYTLENFRPLIGKGADLFIRQAMLIQDTLGDMHNFHVWQETTSTLQPIPFVIHACHKGQAKAYRQFHRAWNSQKKGHLWKRLKKMI